jgi:hypothetical protein
LRDEASRFLKFVKSLVQIARFLELKPTLESLSGVLQIFGVTMAGRRASGIRA